jgi:hypothetical protein
LSYLCRLCVDFVLVNFLIISSCVENVIFLVSYRGININKVYKIYSVYRKKIQHLKKGVLLTPLLSHTKKEGLPTPQL